MKTGGLLRGRSGKEVYKKAEEEQRKKKKSGQFVRKVNAISTKTLL